MRGLFILAAASALTVAAIVDASAMGGVGGGYTASPNFGNMSAAPSEYAAAVRLIKHDKCAEALPHLNNALQKRPDDADVLNYLGYCQRIIGNYQFSLDYYAKALTIDPNHKGVHEYLGELYLKMNQLDKANSELTALATLCPRGCDERDTLTKAIAAYQPPAAAAPAEAPAPTTQQQ
jgi:tetratricopeptide (TPR) repeat protein